MYPNLVSAYNNVTIKTKPYSNVVTINSTAGVPFLSFAKNAKFNKELYEDLVAPTLDTNLYVESWRYGDDLLPSNCSETDEYVDLITLLTKNIVVKL